MFTRTFGFSSIFNISIYLFIDLTGQLVISMSSNTKEGKSTGLSDDNPDNLIILSLASQFLKYST